MARGSLFADWEGKLGKLLELANGVARDGRSALVERAAKVIGSQQKREFRTGIGPDGKSWPSAKDARASAPLVRSGTLKKSAYAKPEGGSVRFGFGAAYAAIVQKGRGGVPARALIPDANALGAVWGPRLLGSLRQLVAKMMKGEKPRALAGAPVGGE